MSTIKAIETHYKGYRFRSRLEARWAVFFDALGLKWEYEKEGYELPSGRYLPDFFVHSPKREDSNYRPHAWFEIKPEEPTKNEVALLMELAICTGRDAYFLIGPPREGEFYCQRTWWTPFVSHAVPFYPDESGIRAALATGEHPDLVEVSCDEDNQRIGEPNRIIHFAARVDDCRKYTARIPYPWPYEDTPKGKLCEVYPLILFNLPLIGDRWVDDENLTEQRLQAGFAAASSARFEFGETPK